jgi:hypothetical protein
MCSGRVAEGYRNDGLAGATVTGWAGAQVTSDAAGFFKGVRCDVTDDGAFLTLTVALLGFAPQVRAGSRD